MRTPRPTFLNAATARMVSKITVNGRFIDPLLLMVVCTTDPIGGCFDRHTRDLVTRDWVTRVGSLFAGPLIPWKKGMRVPCVCLYI